MLKVDTRDLKRLEEHLERYAKRSLPYAIRNGLNTTAFEARKEWVAQLPKAFTLRNTWTEKGLRVDKAGGRSIATMESRVGSIRDYMGEQEQGYTQRKRGKHGVAIPTAGASGQGKKARRTRSIRRSSYLSALNVVKTVTGGRQRRNAVAIALAAKAGGVAYLDLGKRKGLFSIQGKPKGGLKIRMLYDLSKPTVVTKPHKTLEPAIEKLMPRLPAIQERALLDELRKQRILGYGL